MGVVVGLGVGVGLLLVLSAVITPPRDDRAPARRAGGLRARLDAAGLGRTRVGTLVVTCAALGVAVTVLA